MNDVLLRRLERRFAESPILVAQPVNDPREIADAEHRLGCKFDPDYVEFIHRFGGAMVGPWPIIGLRCSEVMGPDTVVDVTERFRADGWSGVDQWYIVSVDHAGNPIGIDREGRVWLSDHDFGEIVLLATRFEDFVASLLQRSASR